MRNLVWILGPKVLIFASFAYGRPIKSWIQPETTDSTVYNYLDDYLTASQPLVPTYSERVPLGSYTPSGGAENREPQPPNSVSPATGGGGPGNNAPSHPNNQSPKQPNRQDQPGYLPKTDPSPLVPFWGEKVPTGFFVPSQKI